MPARHHAIVRSVVPRIFNYRLFALLAALGCGSAQAQGNPAQPDQQAIQEIFACVQVGLPENWQRAWIVVRELAGTESDPRVEGRFFHASSQSDLQGQPLLPCNSERAAREVYGLNKELMQQWREVRLVFYREGKYELRYDDRK